MNRLQHSHHDHHDAREASRRSLLAALVMTALLMVAEFVGGIMSGSLALLAHAGYMLVHVAALGFSLFAIRLSQRPVSVHRTYGHNRMEILAAATNVCLMWLFMAYIVWAAVNRFISGETITNDRLRFEGVTLAVLGVAGIVLRLAVIFVLHRSSKQSLSVEAALRHATADSLSSAALAVSGMVVAAFDEASWVASVDPVLSLMLVLLVLSSSWQLVSAVLLVLVEGTPKHLDLYKLCHDFEEVPGVTLVHDIHAWTVTSGYVALTAHVLVDPEFEGDHGAMLRELRRIARVDHGIDHSTVQLETSASDCTEDHHVDHLLMREMPRRSRRWILLDFAPAGTGPDPARGPGSPRRLVGVGVRLRLPCIDLRVPGDEAQDPLPEPPAI